MIAADSTTGIAGAKVTSSAYHYYCDESWNSTETNETSTTDSLGAYAVEHIVIYDTGCDHPKSPQSIPLVKTSVTIDGQTTEVDAIGLLLHKNTDGTWSLPDFIMPLQE